MLVRNGVIQLWDGLSRSSSQVTDLWMLLTFCLVLPWLLLQSQKKTRSVLC